MSAQRRVAYVIGFGAPPVLLLGDFIELLGTQGWDSYVILSPTAARWVDVDALVRASGHPVRVEPRAPKKQGPLPLADAVFAAPLTFNSLNKWAAGISDTLALGLLNEALGLHVPITAALFIKHALQLHPAYAENTARLTEAGVTMLDLTAEQTSSGIGTVSWKRLLNG